MKTFSRLDKRIQNHIIENVLRPSGYEPDDINKEMIASAWFEKEQAFTRQTGELGMVEVDLLDQNDDRAALALTFSGSLIGIGPNEGATRRVIYSSIGMRTDVPDQAVSERSALRGPLAKGEAAEFKGGPIVKSSPLYRIAMIAEGAASLEDQRETISEATRIITEEFVDVNKTVILD